MRSGFINRLVIEITYGSIISPSVEIPHNFNFSVDGEAAEISRDKWSKVLRKVCLTFCFTVPILLSMRSDAIEVIESARCDY